MAMSPAFLLFNTVVAVSTLVSVLVGLVAVRLLTRPTAPGEALRVAAPAVLAAVALVATFAAVKILVFGFLGLSLFSLLRVLFADVAIGLPLGGAALLLAGRVGLLMPGLARLTTSARLVALGLMVPAPLAAYAVLVEPDQVVLEVARHPVDGLSSGRPPLRVAVLADLQFRFLGDHERSAVALAMAQEPDLILLPGDVYSGPLSGYREQRSAILDMLSTLRAPGGVYLVEGDHDADHVLEDIRAHTGITWLRNEVATLTVAGTRVAIGGIELDYDSRAARLALAQLSATPADTRLVLAHRPDVVFVLPEEAKVDLVIAGHTHGGQVQLPWIGPLVTLSRVPRAAAGGGLSEVAGRSLYVSRGVGMERGWAPPVRFMCKPEVSLLHLVAAD